jgi:hypothetical protein
VRTAKRLVVIASVAAASACTLPFVEQERSVRVLVYNIHAGKDAAGKPNLEAIARLIRAHAADVVLLQEVDRGTQRSGGVDQLQVLMDGTGFGGAFGRTLDYDGGLYGIAALSRDGFGYEDTVSLLVSPPQARAGGKARGAPVTVVHTPFGRWQASRRTSTRRGRRLPQQEAEELRAIIREGARRGCPDARRRHERHADSWSSEGAGSACGRVTECGKETA